MHNYSLDNKAVSSKSWTLTTFAQAFWGILNHVETISRKQLKEGAMARVWETPRHQENARQKVQLLCSERCFHSHSYQDNHSLFGKSEGMSALPPSIHASWTVSLHLQPQIHALFKEARG